MIKGLLKGILGPIALVLAGIVAGAFGTMKLQKPVSVPEYECPDCNCPQPTVSVQPFEVEKIKGLRSFVYSPQFSGSIQVAGVDSAALRRMIDQSMDQAFHRYVEKGKPTSKNRFRKSFKEADSVFNRLTPELIDKIVREAADRTDQKFASKIKQLTE